MSLGGIVKSSKLSQIEYLRFEEKIKLSLNKYSKSFSSNNAPLKKPSLAAKKGLKFILVFELKPF